MPRTAHTPHGGDEHGHARPAHAACWCCASASAAPSAGQSRRSMTCQRSSGLRPSRLMGHRAGVLQVLCPAAATVFGEQM